MPLSNYASYVDRVTRPMQRIRHTKDGSTTVAGQIHSLWRTAPRVGAIPAGAAICDRNLAGAMPLANPATVMRLAQVEGQLGAGAAVIIADRLYHVGGLNGTVTTAQAVTPLALTRYTSGIDVMAALEIYTAVGSTAVVATLSYTDETDAVRTSPEVTFGSASHNQPGRFILVPLAQGSRGVKLVHEVTLSASTGIAGNFGVTLFRPLLLIPGLSDAQTVLADVVLGLAGNLAPVLPDACLWLVVAPRTITVGPWAGELRVIEE